MKFQNTEQFTKYWLSSVTSEAMQKQYPSDWYFDFRFTTQDLPFDWNEENFLNYFKQGFNFPLKRINLDFVNGKYICVGKVTYEPQTNTNNIFIEHTH